MVTATTLRAVRRGGLGVLHHRPPAAGVDGDDRRLEHVDRLHRPGDGVGDVVQLEVEEDRQADVGDLVHAVVAVRAEELEPELEPADVRLDLARPAPWPRRAAAGRARGRSGCSRTQVDRRGAAALRARRLGGAERLGRQRGLGRAGARPAAAPRRRCARRSRARRSGAAAATWRRGGPATSAPGRAGTTTTTIAGNLGVAAPARPRSAPPPDSQLSDREAAAARPAAAPRRSCGRSASSPLLRSASRRA